MAGASLYVHYVVASASNTYGTFAGVIGLLSFIYLSVHIALLAAETNVVATRRLRAYPAPNIRSPAALRAVPLPR